MKPTPILQHLYSQGVEAFLYFGQLAAIVKAGGPMPEGTAAFIRENKEKLIAEIKSMTATGVKISFDKFAKDYRHNPKE